MGSTLTGSTVASTYQSILKTTDNASVTSTLKTITDGSGVDTGLQVSTTDVNVAQTGGNFTVNTNKLTVAGSSGNTAVAGTLGVTGNLAVNTNKFTVAAATGNTVISGTATVSGSATVNGDISTNGRVVLNGNYGVNQNSAGGSSLFVGPVTFNGITTFTAAPNFSTNVTFNNNVTINGTATLAGVSALNGNITLGDAALDTLTVPATSTFNGPVTLNGNTLTINSAFNPNTETLASNDYVLIQDVSDSNKIKKVLSSTVGTTVTVKESGLIDVPVALSLAQYNHNLGVKPTQYQAVFVCSEDNNGYVVGDELDISSVLLVDQLSYLDFITTTISGYRPGFIIYCDSSNLYARRTRSLGLAYLNGAGTPGYDLLVIPSKNVGDLVLISDETEKWKIKFKAINI